MQHKDNQTWVFELVDAAEACVIGYEKYLKDKITSKDLAKLMKQLRNLLPMDLEGKIEEK
jgi:hypothetical protein